MGLPQEVRVLPELLSNFGWVSRAPAAINGLAMLALVLLPGLVLSLSAVRWGHAYRFHQLLQTLLGAALLVTLLVFEWEVRRHDWRIVAQDSRFYDSWVMPALIFHLCFAIPTALMWALLIYHSWKNFPRRARPGKYSMIHKRLGRIAALMMVGTAASGWLFYFLAFIY